MDAKRAINRCKLKNASCYEPPLIDQLIATQLTEDIMNKYNINKKKRDRLKKFQTEFVRKTKIATIKKPLVPVYLEVPSLVNAHKLIHGYATRCPFTEMSRFQERDIIRTIKAGELEKKFPFIIRQIIEEAREQFVTITHDTGIHLKAKPIESSYRCQLNPYKFLGKTQRFPVYIWLRKELQSKLMLHYPLIRRILSECLTTFPSTLFNIGVFRSQPYSVNELNDSFKQFISDSDIILNRFYRKIVSFVENDKMNQGPADYVKYLDACTGLVSVYIGRVIALTIKHINQVTASKDLSPYLKFTISYQGRLILKPTQYELSFIYMLFVTKLVEIGRQFHVLHKYKLDGYDDKLMHLNITDEFVSGQIDAITKNISDLNTPIMNYVNRLEKEFSEIYDDIKTIDIKDSELTFSNGYQQILHYDSFINKASNMKGCEYFHTGTLVLSEYVKTMKESLSAVIFSIFSKLCAQQIQENQSICESFEMVKSVAEEQPNSTEELIKQGQFMIWVKTKLLHELQARIQDLLCNFTKLVDYGTISPEHMQMNAITVNWLKKIIPILEQNSIMYEQLKFEAEEKLQSTKREVNSTLAEMIPNLAILDNMDDVSRVREYLNSIAEHMVKIRDVQRKHAWINDQEKCLGFPQTTFKTLKEVENYIFPFYHLLCVCRNIQRHIEVCLDGQFEFHKYEYTESLVEDFTKELLKMQKAYRLRLRQAQAENLQPRFSGVVDDPEITNWPAPSKLITMSLALLRDFRPVMNMMRIMCNETLMERHWIDMSEIAGFDLTPNAGTSLRKMMNMGLEDDIDQYDVISSAATKERELLNNLHKMQAEWVDIRFKVSTFKDTGVMILTSLDDIQVVLDDHILKTLTMRGSIFVKPYEAEVKLFYEKLSRINSTLEEWGKVQSQWLYLLPIFSSKDIVSQMPEEGNLFKEVNDNYKKYMDVVVRDPRVFQTAGAVGVLEAMQYCSELLDRINEGVTSYLEKKRLYFARFFFLSNDEMLEILSETKDPLRVQPHLKKCFEAIDKLQFDENLKVLAMFSEELEKINFKSPVNVKEAGGSVEKWLVQVEEQMVVSVRDQILRSFKNYFIIPRTQWVQKWPGQVVLAVSQMHWTSNIHNALNREEGLTVAKYFKALKAQLQEIVALIRDPTLTNLTRITIKALIVIDVHAKDVVEELLVNKVDNDKEFKWLSQMRYYLQNDEAVVKLINAEVNYAYEYLGNSDRLVITPLTDRCYRTLIGAYHLHLNGAPEGPAGTGKTETTKDLAKAIAVQCVVFNCSDGLDYKSMGKFFKGLAACGAWSCFDEFNRIDIEVLSVVAQQILLIIMAVRGKLEQFNFEGTEISLNPAVYVCITMNPGYAGRTELPDNLKVLFRTVAMMVPDYAMIGEISLYSYGFVNARNLSVKIVTVYRLCSEQLSSQNHYDYGMRAVKSVLSAAGNNKRKTPNDDENILLLRAILDVNLPKFLNQDLGLFDGIICDLFPNVVLEEADYRVLKEAMLTCIEKRKLQPRESFMTKIIQTYEMMIVRHGFMMVGEPFAGKTSTLRVLADTLTLINEQGGPEEKVQFETLNPKAITMGQLYGQFDPISYEWFDGVAAIIFRNFTTDPAIDRKWIIFDGPVDAVWIENMNTTLDDNKKMCLMSGEVMCMTRSMSLIFEVMDLEQASPATVSRCGMIYMEPSTLGWEPFFESWLPTCNPQWFEKHEDYVIDMFHWIVPPCLAFMKHHCVQYCYPGEISTVRNMMSMVEMFMDDACAGIKKEEELKNVSVWLQATFLQAGAWGLASVLDLDSRYTFDEYYKQLWRGQLEDYPYPDSFERLDIYIPPEGTILDYIYIYRMKGSWKYWPDMVKGERIEECTNVLQALIPTVDTARYMHLIEMHIRHKKQVLLVGPTGTGKSFYIQDLLMNQIDKNLYEPAFITFTVQISANQTQDLVISKLNKRRRGHYGAPKGKTAILFIDDVNMPVKEKYGAQPPIELLRQFFDHRNWYDLKTITPLYLHDVLFIGAMGLVGGSRQEIYARFLRHFGIFSINEFSQDTMAKIYSNILLLAWKNNGFPSDVYPTVSQTVNASLDMYREAMKNLRPTPSKSHYVFNLRDFSRLIQGCGMIKKESSEDHSSFVKSWVHEVLRVFYDRLIEQDDKDWVFQKLKQCVRDHFKENFEQVFDSLPRDEEGRISQYSMKNLFFGTYFDQESDENKRYEEIKNLNEFLELSTMVLEEYNATHKRKVDIVLFDYALEHLSRICRVLSMSCGSALLVGISGSGRQSLTRLASALYNYHLYQPEITNNYGLNEWRDDIKKILKEAGGRGKDCIFLITEGQIKEEIFLQDVDCLLNSGEVPNIYQIDEKQEILDMVRLAAQGGNRNLDISVLSVFFYFTKRCREKLHIILCFSPVGTTFRNRLRLYPSLINCCSINWFEEWPETALEQVAHRWMEDINLSDEVKFYSVIACKHFHVTAREASNKFYQSLNRKTYITSASYLELIRSFTDLTNKKQNELTTARNRYLGGLDKLSHAYRQIGEMQTELNDLQPQLKEMSLKAIEMTRLIEQETIEVAKASAMVKKDEVIANKQAAASAALKAECEADLAEAMPILNEAISALDTLKPTDITLVKSMKNPPAAIKLVMAAVCIIKGVKPDKIPDYATGTFTLDYWPPSKRVLGDMNFLQNLKDFDKDNIPPEIMAKLRRECIPHKSFKPHIVARASTAAEGLCKWIIAMDVYDKVNKIVAPKKARLAAAELEFAETMALLKEKRDMVVKLEAQLADLNEKLDDAVQKQTDLQDNVNLCNSKLTRAHILIGGLGGERTRWTAVAATLQLQYDNIAGDILISCGVMCYLSPFTSKFRQDMMTDWHRFILKTKIPCADVYDLVFVLGTDVKIQNWYIGGLPRDTFSTENGIIQDNSRRWSLLIDPQGQANNWIKKMEKSNYLEVVKFSYSDYMKTVSKCVQLGLPVLIENIEEELEAPLDALLFKMTFRQAGMEVISLGENVIEYNPNFKLYLTSKLRNPHYLPEVYNRVTVINFSLTLEGLQDQLLGIVVAVEKPELQQLKEELIVQKAENKGALVRTEERILKTLAESQGDILEDETAIQILDESKTLAITIGEKQEKSLEIEKSIEQFRVKYQGVSEHSAVLYYCISDLANVDPMYQYSLEWFINLYISSIQNAEKFRSIEKRCFSLINAFTYDLYSNITRSLFEKDKLLFSFLLCTKIMISKNQLDEHEFMFLLTGGVSVENPLENPFTWLPNSSWEEMCKVEHLQYFKNFARSVKDNESKWKHIYDNFEDHFVVPQPWTDMNSFRRLITIRILRPDKLLSSLANFVRHEMDEKFVKPPQFDISISYSNSFNLCPLIFILSPGTDPMTSLVKFAQEMKYSFRLKSISLGQGQGPIAQALIHEATESGLWVCLQNCHLATSWMPSMEKIIENLDAANTHKSFRLWLTSYPSPKFPVSVLQKGVKMTNEPPTGLQNNLLKSYTSNPVKNPLFYDGCPDHESMFSRLLYGLAFFHALVQERRTFGPLGWNIPYGFNDSDFDISVQQLQMFINESNDPYEALIYLIGECNYGGRVTDDWDRRLIVTILDDFLNPKVADDMNYRFSTISDCYNLPEQFEYSVYLEHIRNLPPIHPPEIFGLHSNAGITRDLQDSKQLLESILKAYGETSSGAVHETDKYITILCTDILSRLPELYDLEDAYRKYPVEYSESMNTVLVQEMERFNKLLKVMKASLTTMNRAIQGLVAMSPPVEAFANSLLLGKIPESWGKVTYPSLKSLPNYITDFLARIEFLTKWLHEGKPHTYWVSGFFFTQAFLTGVKQNFARKYTIPIDKLTFDFEVLKVDTMKAAPKDGAFIYGLFTDGARWDNKKGILEELHPKVLHDYMPLIWIKPIESVNYNEKGRYKCPVYKTSERRGVLSTTGHSTNYVVYILLDTVKNSRHWIKRSMALLCQPD